MNKAAHRRKFDFLICDDKAEKYLLFLKQQILNLKPQYYAVVHAVEVKTSDGPMFAVRITGDIEHPEFEPIAEAWINGQLIYLWRDHCWGIGVDDNGKQILMCDDRMIDPTDVEHRNKSLNKTMLLFRIGTEGIS